MVQKYNKYNAKKWVILSRALLSLRLPVPRTFTVIVLFGLGRRLSRRIPCTMELRHVSELWKAMGFSGVL
jgi:hypothetical protein